jgi:transcriptional regulator with XRE-family HTH domain
MSNKEPTYQTEREIFPIRLRALMEETNTTQEQLGEALGVRRQTISLYMNGQSKPDWRQVAKIAKYFTVSGDYLLGLSAVKTTSVEIKNMCDYTGLNEHSIKTIKGLSSKVNGVYPAGFTDNDFSPIDLINYILTDSAFFLFLVEFCDAVNYQKRSTKSSAEIIELKKANLHLIENEIELVSFEDMAEYKRLKAQDFLDSIWFRILFEIRGEMDATENDT